MSENDSYEATLRKELAAIEAKKTTEPTGNKKMLDEILTLRTELNALMERALKRKTRPAAKKPDPEPDHFVFDGGPPPEKMYSSGGIGGTAAPKPKTAKKEKIEPDEDGVFRF